ncbi:MAG TPA: hypothetical protein VFC09_02935 [Candidatus Dormibacteraeota bacterium]|nr:hypothetical protein [Candidatus Dormibacteraeota bacterium]
MLKRLSFLKRLVLDLPRQVKLTYCLLFDERVPAVSKAAVLGAMAVIVTPFVNLPEWVPVIGEMDLLALTLLATRAFISTAPREAVEEQERRVKEQTSRFDVDVARGQRLAVALAHRFGREQKPQMEFVGVAQDRLTAVGSERSEVA